jgi:hypothetical protein
MGFKINFLLIEILISRGFISIEYRKIFLKKKFSDLYSGVARFESRPGHRLSLSWLPQILEANYGIVPKSGHDRALQRHFQFTINSGRNIQRYKVEVTESVGKINQ